METDAEDIRRVLAICFRGESELDALDIERILSLDMGWLKPEEATTAVQAMIKTGWLVGGQEELSPAGDFSASSTPLGWYPRPQRLLNPVSFRSTSAVEGDVRTEPVEETQLQQTPITAQLKEEANDPRAATTRRLLKYIARSSGLEIDEVQRRATRKQRALVHVTGWMALALVARDQGLDMESVIQALS
ncbi:MAG: hypothetical protein CMA16_04130 [Euryarchaeota archaeon]|nr:hypothetical protein [Euryarchaeota archaeon]|tara:strand:- start:1368 stop:1937 length:570 start_codon:yes stop_codon:yes gene_type:complete